MIWWRYIDDIFFIWEHDEESLRVFIDQINLFHATIKFTAEYSKEEVNFLDLNIKLIDGGLRQTCLLKVQILISFQIQLPPILITVKKGIPYSQALRLNRICSDNANFDKRCNDLEKWLMERVITRK